MDNYNLTINGVFGMDFLDPSEKLLLILFITNKSLGNNIINVGKGAYAIGWTRQGFNKVNRRLIEKGLTKEVKRAYYSLNETNIF
jgi:hypothetical protein